MKNNLQNDLKNFYNKKQLAVINSKEPKILVTAPPGSGKTRLLVGAIQKFYEENPGSRVVALTFTNKATNELRARLGVGSIQIYTIDAWCRKEINKLAVQFQFPVNIIEELKINELLQFSSVQCGFPNLNQKLLRMYASGIRQLDAKKSVIAMCNKAYDFYVNYKRENQLYDFTDYPLCLLDILTKHPEAELEDIDGLFIDEFQDVDNIQAQIFAKINARKTVYIGDIDQSIYLFRGAGPQNLKNLEGFTRYELDINYRSYQPIIDFATQLHYDDVLSILDIDCLAPSNITCIRQENLGIVAKEEKGKFYNLINDKYYDMQSGIDYFMQKQPCILCRSNKQVIAIQKMGYDNAITIHKAKGLEFDNVIVVDFPIMGNEEETNVAYVACTRAKDGLLVINFETLCYFLPKVLAKPKKKSISALI